jgi:hypothetical protein
MELNDIGLFARHGYTGEEYLKAVTDQFETLYSESQKLARVMVPASSVSDRAAFTYQVFSASDRSYAKTGSGLVRDGQ